MHRSIDDNGTPIPDNAQDDGDHHAFNAGPVHRGDLSFTGAGIGDQIETDVYQHVPHWVGQAIDNSDNPPPPSNLDNEGDPPEDQGEQGPDNSSGSHHRLHFTGVGIGDHIATSGDHHETDTSSTSDSSLGVVEAIQGGNPRGSWIGEPCHVAGDLPPLDQGDSAGIGERTATGSAHHEPHSSSNSGEIVSEPAWHGDPRDDGDPPQNPEGDNDSANSGPPRLVLPDLPHFVAGGGPAGLASADAGAIGNVAHGGGFWDRAAAATLGMATGGHLSISGASSHAAATEVAFNAAMSGSAHEVPGTLSDTSAHSLMGAHDVATMHADLHGELGTATLHEQLTLSSGSFAHQMHV
jgi:hypothetical protein